MPASLTVDWQNENSYRMYPFLENADRTSSLSYKLTNNVVLDVNLYLTGYPIPDNVKLVSIVVATNAVTFTFTGSNVFTVSDRTAISFPFYTSRTSNGSFLVVGDDILLLPQGTHTFTALTVEPAVCFEMSNAWNGITQVLVDPEYQTITNSVAPLLPLTPVVSGRAFTGDIELVQGYNFNIDFVDQTIRLGAGASYGLPLSCAEEFIDPDLKDCGKIISYINGVAPDSSGKFTIRGGSNVNIIDGRSTDAFIDDIDTDASLSVPANPHTLFVGLSFSKTDICAPIAIIPAT